MSMEIIHQTPSPSPSPLKGEGMKEMRSVEGEGMKEMRSVAGEGMEGMRSVEGDAMEETLCLRVSVVILPAGYRKTNL